MEKSLRECATECIDKDECVVLTGHSQGGAIAAVAGKFSFEDGVKVFMQSQICPISPFYVHLQW